MGVEFTFPGVTANTVKQSYGRPADVNYSSFYDSWFGIDNRIDGIGTTFRLNLTGLEADTAFTLTSYHFDSLDQSSTFTTSASGAKVCDFGEDFGGDGTTDASVYTYNFALTSDASGNASIDYINASGLFTGINGFDLTANVPEPSTCAQLVLGLGVLYYMRRRAKA